MYALGYREWRQYHGSAEVEPPAIDVSVGCGRAGGMGIIIVAVSRTVVVVEEGLLAGLVGELTSVASTAV